MSAEKVKYTPQQKEAIENRGGALLVSAAAGSGKTKVLVERLMGYLTDPRGPHKITDFLIITYTKAAAAELREKIIDAIGERLAQEPENRHLRRQASLCYRAQIGTIHSFCAGILRENAHLLELSPDFRVTDESESLVLKRDVLNRVLDGRYEILEQKPAFPLLLDMMSAGRDDSRLQEIVLTTFEKIQCHPYPEKWVEQMIEMLGAPKPDVLHTAWGAVLARKARQTAAYWTEQMEQLLVRAETCPEFLEKYGDSCIGTIQSLRAFSAALDKSWDEARLASKIDFSGVGRLSGYEDLKKIRKDCKAEMEKIAALFSDTSEEVWADVGAVRPILVELFEIVLDFARAYSREKRRRNVIDFSDQEHMAVQLLIDPEDGGLTKTARELSGRFAEIMIDEYQDINAVQELIFHAVSREDKNIFMVGDVKQSIYRFRLADPTIFLKKYTSFADFEDAKDGQPRRVILSKNFRSRKGILDAVNFLFQHIMSETFGEMDYTEREYLNAGASYPESEDAETELHVLDMGAMEEPEDGESPQKTDIEADYIAGEIEKLLAQGRVSDGAGGTRGVLPGDIAILLRSASGKAGRYAYALAMRGIPASIEKSEGYFETIEMSIMLSLLAVIDNPLQDIPLISVLRSPLYGFTADDLTYIRTFDKKAEFYTALKMAAEENQKCRRFLEELDAFREAAPDMPADMLIWHIYNRTGMLAVMGAMHGGETRKKNLLLLAEYAGQFEKSGYKGLFGFINYVKQLMRQESKLGVPAGDMDSVQIMTIHSSKGLEYPIVVLPDLAKRFNHSDVHKPLLIHPQLGLGPKLMDTEQRTERTTVLRLAIAEQITLETMSEELRVLYVAMTRAREKLIMVCTYADAEKELSRLCGHAHLPVHPAVLRGARSMADWILIPALIRAECTPLRFGQNTGVYIPQDGERPWRVVLASPEGEGHIRALPKKAEADVQAQEEETERCYQSILSQLKYVYPHRAAEQLPSKLTATELKGRPEDEEAAEEAMSMLHAPSGSQFRRPDFLAKKRGLSGAEKGTALHLAMQHIDLGKTGSLEEIRAELQRLCTSGILSEEERQAVSPADILRFFNSDLGRRVQGGDKLWREFKFSVLVPANAVLNDTETEDTVLLQGVVDCAVEEQGEITIIDFKTDYVNNETIQERAAFYKGQLSAYALALEQVMEKPVREKWLYFFKTGTAVLIK